MIRFRSSRHPLLNKAWNDNNVIALVSYLEDKLWLIEEFSFLLKNQSYTDYAPPASGVPPRAFEKFLRMNWQADPRCRSSFGLPEDKMKLYTLVRKVYIESSGKDDAFLGKLRGAILERLISHLLSSKYHVDRKAKVRDNCRIYCGNWCSKKQVDVAAWSPEKQMLDAHEAKLWANRFESDEFSNLSEIKQHLAARCRVILTGVVSLLDRSTHVGYIVPEEYRADIAAFGWDNICDLAE